MKTKFIRRTLAIYRRDKMAIFFSFLALLITLLIYVFFLRDNILLAMPKGIHAKKYVDLWMIAGLISIVGISASLAPFEQRIKDNLDHKQDDFIVNNQMTKWSMSVSYLIAAIIEASLSTLAFIVIAYAYLYVQAKSLLSVKMFVQTIGYAFLLVLFGCLFFACITNLVNSISVFSSLSAIVGALTGFFSGSYIIFGELPSFMQKLVVKWPGYEIAGLIRNIMVKNVAIPSAYKPKLNKGLGILTDAKSAAFVLIIWILILLVLLLVEAVMSNRNSRIKKLERGSGLSNNN
ncbi:multidrug ABC transporter permease [Lentilactobacillus fungorum]|uniref:Multidrug ABC transporter permease n=1 Tax=Lentilactobacillus fungorum TaxID=2201250 RepID=A0ABQ3VYR5_9LACO|nr:ABC transporter permease [Lentilactobacillus fungorum]GHP13484.1 multidrug ABC transporter permease [Lentilactobacillus fungorum]